MNISHVISVKSNGREVAIVMVKQHSLRYEIECVRTVSDATKDNARIANAIVFALGRACEKLDASFAEPSPFAETAN